MSPPKQQNKRNPPKELTPAQRKRLKKDKHLLDCPVQGAPPRRSDLFYNLIEPVIIADDSWEIEEDHGSRSEAFILGQIWSSDDWIRQWEREEQEQTHYGSKQAVEEDKKPPRRRIVFKTE